MQRQDTGPWNNDLCKRKGVSITYRACLFYSRHAGRLFYSGLAVTFAFFFFLNMLLRMSAQAG